MVNLPDEHELNELQAFSQDNCLSIYIPLLDTSDASNSNRIKLKNLLREAKTALLAAGVHPSDVDKTLRPVHHLLKNRELWPPRHDSLALFMHPKLFRYYHIPTQDTPRLLSVETGFNLEPLIKIINNNRQYFVLALSHKNVRIYEANRYDLKQLHLKDFPTDMKQALNIDEYPDWLETHSVALGGLTSGDERVSEGFHGQYNVRQTDKDMLLEFFRLIDHSLHSLLRDKKSPLIIIGVEYLLPIYRQANSSSYLVKGGLVGNFEKSDLEIIHAKTWAYLESTIKKL